MTLILSSRGTRPEGCRPEWGFFETALRASSP
jgi:hypothetical protein